jgi:hypothetical protein
LVEILSPHVAKVVVVHVSESRGQKSDEHDSFSLAERLRAGTIAASVFKQVGSFATLRQLVKAHRMIVQDSTERRVGVGGEHPLHDWTRRTVLRDGPKSPNVGYALRRAE